LNKKKGSSGGLLGCIHVKGESHRTRICRRSRDHKGVSSIKGTRLKVRKLSASRSNNKRGFHEKMGPPGWDRPKLYPPLKGQKEPSKGRHITGKDNILYRRKKDLFRKKEEAQGKEFLGWVK